MLPLNHINSLLSRAERLRLNENWVIITNGVNSIQAQLNKILGGEVDQIIKDIENALATSEANAEYLAELLLEVTAKMAEAQTAINKANTATTQANAAKDAANTATVNANTATTQANNAKNATVTATNNANTATATVNAKITEITTAINSVTTTLNDAISKLSTFNTDSEKALTDFETDSTEAINKVNVAAQNADNAASEAREVASNLEGYNDPIKTFNLTTTFKKHNAARFNGSTYRAKVETTGNPLPVSPSVENTWWTLEAQRGVDGIGSVSSVNGILPESDGNVILPDKEEFTKLVSHQFTVKATTNGQTKVEIPLGTFDKEKDTLLLFRNTTAQTPAMYSVSGKTITLVNPVVDGANTEFHMLIMANVLTGTVTSEIQEIMDVFSNNLTSVDERLTKQLDQSVASETGVHDIRYFNNKLETSDGSIWSEIKTGFEVQDYSIGHLDDLTNTGIYTSKGVTVEKGFPVALSILYRPIIEVFKSSDTWTLQRFTYFNNNSTYTFERGKAFGTWNKWVKLASNLQENFIDIVLTSGSPVVENRLAYYKDSFGTVHIEGSANTASKLVSFTMPVGYRPVKRTTSPVIINGAVTGVVDLQTNGYFQYSGTIDGEARFNLSYRAVE